MKPKKYYVVMAVASWDSIKTPEGYPLKTFGNRQPCGFLPVFTRKRDAADWAKVSNNAMVVEMKTTSAYAAWKEAKP